MSVSFAESEHADDGRTGPERDGFRNDASWYGEYQSEASAAVATGVVSAVQRFCSAVCSPLANWRYSSSSRSRVSARSPKCTFSVRLWRSDETTQTKFQD